MCDDKKEILTTNSYRERIGRGKTCRLTRPPLLQFFPFSFFPQRVAWEKFSSLIPRLQFPKKTHLRRLVTIWRSIKLTNQKMQETICLKMIRVHIPSTWNLGFGTNSLEKIIIKYDKNIFSNEKNKTTLKVIPQQFRKLHVKVPITK